MYTKSVCVCVLVCAKSVCVCQISVYVCGGGGGKGEGEGEKEGGKSRNHSRCWPGLNRSQCCLLEMGHELFCLVILTFWKVYLKSK